MFLKTTLTLFMTWCVLSAGLLAEPKAEALRIHFARGASSATVRGQLRGEEDMEYAVTARSKQTILLQLAGTPLRTLTLQLRDPDNNELHLQAAGADQWSAILPQDGDYQIWVVRALRPVPPNLKQDVSGTSRFRLTVTIH